MNLCIGVRIEIHYSTIRLSTYMSHTKKESYKDLDQ